MTQRTLDLPKKGVVNQWTDSLLHSDFYEYIIVQILGKDIMTPLNFCFVSYINFISCLNFRSLSPSSETGGFVYMVYPS